MSGPIGSGYSEREYDKRKKARDFVERKLIENGANPEKAKEIADRTARETDQKRRQQGKE